MKEIILGISILLAWIFGYATPILAVINFAWMLFKDTQLFSWWYVIFALCLFLTSVVTLFVLFFTNK